MCELLKKAYDVKLSCVFTSSKVKDYFSLKCSSHPYLSANVVYKFTCQSDSDNFYIGQTQRHIGIRAEDHLNTESDSAVGDHIRSCNECRDRKSNGLMSFQDFTILKSCKSKSEVIFQEALLIKRLNPPMNRQLLTSGSATALKIYA